MQTRFSPVITADAAGLAAVLETLDYRLRGELQLSGEISTALWVRGEEGVMLIAQDKRRHGVELVMINSSDCLRDQARLKRKGMKVILSAVYSAHGVHACFTDADGRLIVLFEHRVYENVPEVL
jgi:hypothetical protein